MHAKADLKEVEIEDDLIIGHVGELNGEIKGEAGCDEVFSIPNDALVDDIIVKRPLVRFHRKPGQNIH